jgi:hypothetical protein
MTLHTLDETGPLRLLTAGWRAGDRLADYGVAVQSFNLGDLYVQCAGETYFDWLRGQLEQSADVVLIDSRTGITEMGGVCTRQLADVVVSLCTPSRQSLQGVRAMTESFRRESLLSKRGRDLQVVVVPTRIEVSEIEAREAFKKEFHDAVDRFTPLRFRDKQRDFWQLRIPYVPLYAYGETLAVGQSKPIEELYSAYQQLAGCLALLAPDGKLADVWDRLQRSSATSGATIASVFSVPTATPDFTGRGELLDEIDSRLGQGGTVVLVGLPGSGKTALAAEYAQRHQSELDLAWWMSAATPAALSEGYTNLANALGLVPTDNAGALDAVRNWLERNQRWLLVIDDAPSLDALEHFLPRVRHGQCLITSRNRAFASADGLLSVGPLRRPESMQLLLRRSGSDDGEAASGIAEEVGDLPLALVLSARYAQTTGRSLRDVLELLRNHARRLLEDLETPLGQTIDEIGVESPAATSLLTLCAFLGREEIPVDTLLSGSRIHVPDLAEATGDPFVMDEAVAALRRYSLVDRGHDGLRVHPLVQAAARARLPPETCALWSARALAVVAQAAGKGPVAAHLRPAIDGAKRAVDAVAAPSEESATTVILLAGAREALVRADLRDAALDVLTLARPLARAWMTSMLDVSSPEADDAASSLVLASPSGSVEPQKATEWHVRLPSWGRFVAIAGLLTAVVVALVSNTASWLVLAGALAIVSGGTLLLGRR